MCIRDRGIPGIDSDQFIVLVTDIRVHRSCGSRLPDTPILFFWCCCTTVRSQSEPSKRSRGLVWRPPIGQALFWLYQFTVTSQTKKHSLFFRREASHCVKMYYTRYGRRKMMLGFIRSPFFFLSLLALRGELFWRFPSRQKIIFSSISAWSLRHDIQTYYTYWAGTWNNICRPSDHSCYI